ncbi:MFS transporter [Ktedonobacter racemifer]|uniref:Major facilitator superfamily MFS_1 n=1 Tax=Ktedonobacter racemifer DSM 44963 TaxID=485913 RepID=D6TP10_KTERA|nr:MFS transporter [Ktedonobacter racemifer]EFH85546.1 major facilitator superfamily MFS_1 [Ktedonobacter racemifer DSM 44963]
MSTFRIATGQRSLEHYPTNAQRIWYLALAVIATIILYYESYVLPSVAPLVLHTFGLSVADYSRFLLVSNLLGALSAIFGSLSDRIGRSTLIIYGLLITAIGTLIIALASSLWLFLLLIWVVGFIEGIILVVTPALVRDFSPRFGRALAMGFWTVGPVGGSVLATGVASQTLSSYGSWQSQYVIAGIVGFIVFLVCFFFLRELSPRLRDQVMNSMQEKELVEARARNIDPEEATRHPWRQMLNPRLVVSALGISLYLLMYFAAVGFFPLYLSSIFKFSVAQANGLVSIFWLVNVAAAIIIGFISDRTLVRKPYMLFGAIATIIVTLLFISRIGVPTDATLMAVFLSLFGITLAIGYVTWMAAYTETIEDINPALVATGMAVEGFILRMVVVLSTLAFSFVVRNQLDGQQWATWWWVCIAGLVVFVPTIFVVSGYWRPASVRTAIRQREPESPLSPETA